MWPWKKAIKALKEPPVFDYTASIAAQMAETQRQMKEYHMAKAYRDKRA